VTVYVISVGTSVLDTLDKPRDLLRKDDQRPLKTAIEAANPSQLLLKAKKPILDTQKEAASNWITSALAPSGDPERDDEEADMLTEVVKAVRPEQWLPGFSAELQTYRSLTGTWRPIAPRDIVILICSDTPRGLLAGLWNALALTGRIADVMYLPTLSDTGPRLSEARGRVVIARVPGMDAGDDRGFCDAMSGLGILARNVFKYGALEPAEKFKFALSGGYKASTPYLIGMAEAIRSVDKRLLDELSAGQLMPGVGKPDLVRAYVLHDTSPDPIRLPLRRLAADAVRDELADFNAEGSRKKKGLPEYATLEGYAYDAKGTPGQEACELTPFGAGLRELFGVPPEVW
jgi:hypothetical protein